MELLIQNKNLTVCKMTELSAIQKRVKVILIYFLLYNRESIDHDL